MPSKYAFNIYKTIPINDQQEVVVGRIWVDGNEYVGIRERVPGQPVDQLKGVYFPAHRLADVIDATTDLEEFLTGGTSRAPGAGQQSLFGEETS